MTFPAYTTMPIANAQALASFIDEIENFTSTNHPGVTVTVGEHPALGPITLTMLQGGEAFVTVRDGGAHAHNTRYPDDQPDAFDQTLTALHDADLKHSDGTEIDLGYLADEITR